MEIKSQHGEMPIVLQSLDDRVEPAFKCEPSMEDKRDLNQEMFGTSRNFHEAIKQSYEDDSATPIAQPLHGVPLNGPDPSMEELIICDPGAPPRGHTAAPLPVGDVSKMEAEIEQIVMGGSEGDCKGHSHSQSLSQSESEESRSRILLLEHSLTII